MKVPSVDDIPSITPRSLCETRRSATADSSRAKTLAAETGATAISSLKDMAQTSACIVTMLPNTPNVEAVYLGNINLPRVGGKVDPFPKAAAAADRGTENGQGLLDFVKPGTLLVDSSTIDPLASKRINAIATGKVNNETRPFPTHTREEAGGGGSKHPACTKCSDFML